MFFFVRFERSMVWMGGCENCLDEMFYNVNKYNLKIETNDGF